jgi:hypothetical protein
VAETSILFNEAKRRWPDKVIFRDMDASFHLDGLIKHVSRGKNVIILLSGNYPWRPFTLFELLHALKSGINIVPVIITRSGMEPFHFDKVGADIKGGRLREYMAADDWAFLAKHGITEEHVAEDLRAAMDVLARQFSVAYPPKVQDVMIKSILNAVVE